MLICVIVWTTIGRPSLSSSDYLEHSHLTVYIFLFEKTVLYSPALLSEINIRAKVY